MYPTKYIPKTLSEQDKSKQLKMLNKSKNLYQKQQYYTRKKVSSYKYKPSTHILNAKKMYGVSTVLPNQELANATGCSIAALQKIVNKGEGAYYSSGSRPNQTAQSWGLARLASAITAGNASIVDYHILKTCNKTKKAYKLATKKYNSRKT